jgi:hypothetical protein
MVLIAAGLRIGVPESVQATRQPIAKPHRGYAMVERADVRVAAQAAESARMIAVMVLIAAGIAKPHRGYAMVEMAVEATAIFGGANAAVATTFAGTDGTRLGGREYRSIFTTDTTTAIAAGFAGGRELLEALTGGADIANAVTGGEADSRRGPTAPRSRAGRFTVITFGELRLA